MERHILRLLLAMIVMIAAQFLPSAASAHDGHAAHGRHDAHRIETSVPADAASAMASAFSRLSTDVVAKAPRHDCPAQCPACTGCRMAGCCGGAAILSQGFVVSLRVARILAMTMGDLPMPSGIGLDALHEPPRSSA